MSESSSTGRPQRDGGASSGGGILGWLRNLAGGSDEADLRHDLMEILDAQRAGKDAFSADQRKMLLNILRFGELQADDLMVPRTDIVAVEVRSDLDQVVQTFREARHSRLPVYRETLDDLLGFVHIKDIVDFWGAERALALERIVHQLLVVPPNMPALDLLARMQATRIHMAAVVDEYGGTDGLITIEDVVEQIVGEMEDEHDGEEPPAIVELPDGSFDVDGRTEIGEFEPLVGLDLLPDDVDEDIDTLAGLVFHLIGRVPRRGERIRHPAGLELEVLDADPRRIKRLKVRALAQSPRAASR